jgi:hypothetical protein
MEKRNGRSSSLSTRCTWSRSHGPLNAKIHWRRFRVAKLRAYALRGGDLVEAICARGTLVRLRFLGEAMLVTWPFLLLLLDYWPLRRLRMAIIGWAQAIRKSLDATDSRLPLFVSSRLPWS